MGKIKAPSILRPGYKRVYLSGKISGKSKWQYDFDFLQAKWKVKRKFPCFKIDFVNPVKLPAIQHCWEDYIIRDLMLLKECSTIAMLPDWKESAGARVEYEFAKGLDLEIIYL